jgi:hypothetical protein
MPLTRNFKETVMMRARQDPAFRQGLIVEAANAFLDGDVDTGKRLLRDYLNATGSMNNFINLLNSCKRREGIALRVCG